jgi:hypothetical protein
VLLWDEPDDDCLAGGSGLAGPAAGTSAELSALVAARAAFAPAPGQQGQEIYSNASKTGVLLT